MPQLHFYVSEPLAKVIRERADAAGVSTSRYLADLVQREVDGDWPEGFFEQVYGSWQGDELVRPEQPPLEERDEFSN